MKSSGSCSDRLKAVSDPTRLAVLQLLRKRGPSTAGELHRRLGVEQSLLSHHLQILRESGMVLNARAGKSVVYRLASSAKRETLDLGCCEISFKE